MKRIICSLVIISFFFLCGRTYAQSPNSFKFQSMLRKPDGSALANQLIRVRISLLKSGISGQAVYTEVHISQSNTFGLINLNIGDGLEKTGSFTTVDWSADSYFIKVEIDETGASNYTLSNITQLLSVPYSLYSNSAGYAQNAGAIDWAKIQNKPMLFSGNYNDLTNKPTLFSGSYNDLANKPNLFSGNYNDLTAKPTLFSGNYADLTNKPVVVSKQSYDASMSEIWAELNEILIEKGSFKDIRDGQYYTCVKIGDQIWMSENLNYYTPIGSYYYNNDSLTYAGTYGRLYQWATARTACPSGWHLPSNQDWETLFAFLGGNGAAGGKMKSTGTSLWKSPNDAATNSSLFTALPGGFRNTAGAFGQVTETAYFWSNYITTGNSATNLFLSHLHGGVSYVGNSGGLDPAASLSVRCIRN